MVRVTLQMMSLCVVLLLTDRSTTRSGLGANATRCNSAKQMDRRWTRLKTRYTSEVTRMCNHIQGSESGKCEQVINETRNDQRNLRSLSPWELYVDQDLDRFPPEISMARCLCQGCIIQGQENRSYNSVPVCSQMMVLWRKKCPENPDRYVIRKGFINVPVACTCVSPKY